MREILFKCWIPSEKFMGVPFNPFEDFKEDDKPSKWRDDSIFLQFTGLKDKNGTPIFESDIVRLIEPNRLYTVEFNEFSFKLVHADPKLDRLSWGGLNRVEELGWRIEVIGNIYEHPEILKHL